MTIGYISNQIALKFQNIIISWDALVYGFQMKRSKSKYQRNAIILEAKTENKNEFKQVE